MKAINGAGLLKRITTRPNKRRRQEVAKKHVKRSHKEQLQYLTSNKYMAKKERERLAKL